MIVNLFGGVKRNRKTMADPIDIRPLTSADWPAILELFTDRGACGGCWCMYWRVEHGGKTWDAMRGAPARERFCDLVTGGHARGLLAYEDDAPVGWVCVGPYEDFPRLERVRALKRDRPPGTWSIVCFYIPARHRRRGLGSRLLVAARDLALRQGAAVVEGYPVAVRGKAMPGAFAWTGVPAMFAVAGFSRLGSEDLTRNVWVSPHT